MNNLDILKENLNKILDECLIDYDLFKEGIKDQKIKDELKLLTSNAFENIFWSTNFCSE